MGCERWTPDQDEMTEKKIPKGKKPPRRKKMLSAHVTHLEMTHPLLRSLPVPTRPMIALMRAKNISTGFYRYMYELVGKSHHWQDRRLIDDFELDEIINCDECEIHVLYADGCPAGFFEFSTAALPETVEFVHIGISPDIQGLGIGKWFVSTAIRTAWLHKPGRLIVHTNTLDHPAALPLYQRLGFSPFAVSDEIIEPWN